jgi:hypothetical protein
MKTTVEKQTETLEIKLNTRYASQSLSEIPLGYWIDKSTGNCGLSYLALKDNNNSMILVPRVALADNKASQKDIYPNLFVIKAGVTSSDVKDYIAECKKKNLPYKILCTYNSFATDKIDYILEDETCRIYVDESQYLIDFPISYPDLNIEFHKRLEKNVNRVTFFSAHPPKREYLPEYIQAMPSIKYIWKNQVKATPYMLDAPMPYLTLYKILKDLLTKGSYTLEDVTFKKAIVFVNSVDGIKKITERLNSPRNIAYIVGDTVRNDNKLNDLAYRLEDCRNLPIITIGTTSMISGVDLYDEQTFNIVVSTSNKQFTLFDKELDVPQAITRQRLDSNRFNDKFLFIHNVKEMEDKIKSLSETFEKDLKTLNTVVGNLNYLKEGDRDYSVGYERYKSYYFLNDSDSIFYANEYLLKARKYVFEQLYSQYRNGYEVISTNKPTIYKVDKTKFEAPTYYDYATEINEAKTTGDKLSIIKSVENPIWKQLLTYGLEKDKVLVNHKEAVAFYESRNDYKGIIIKINKTFKPNKFYSLVEIKEKLQNIYDGKGLNRKAKATDLNEFFKTKPHVSIINKVRINGLIIS